MTTQHVHLDRDQVTAALKGEIVTTWRLFSEKEEKPKPQYELGELLWVREPFKPEMKSGRPKMVEAPTEYVRLTGHLFCRQFNPRNCQAGITYGDGVFIPIPDTPIECSQFARLLTEYVNSEYEGGAFFPPTEMPKWASRLTLSVLSASVARIRESELGKGGVEAWGVAWRKNFWIESYTLEKLK